MMVDIPKIITYDDMLVVVSTEPSTTAEVSLLLHGLAAVHHQLPSIDISGEPEARQNTWP